MMIYRPCCPDGHCCCVAASNSTLSARGIVDGGHEKLQRNRSKAVPSQTTSRGRGLPKRPQWLKTRYFQCPPCAQGRSGHDKLYSVIPFDVCMLICLFLVTRRKTDSFVECRETKTVTGEENWCWCLSHHPLSTIFRELSPPNQTVEIVLNETKLALLIIGSEVYGITKIKIGVNAVKKNGRTLHDQI